MARSIVRFIREKSNSIGLLGLIRLEVEGWLFALIGWIPGMTGFILRHALLKLTITLGSYVLIGSNVTISSGRHPIDGKAPPIFSRETIPLPIVIEDDVWIGAGAVIMPGVTLRKGTVVGANAVVTRSTEEFAVVVGAPARQIKTRGGDVMPDPEARRS